MSSILGFENLANAVAEGVSQEMRSLKIKIV